MILPGEKLTFLVPRSFLTVKQRIAEAQGGFQLSAPVFFKNGGIPEDAWGKPNGVMDWIQANGDYEKNHIGEIVKAAVADLRRDGCTTVSIFGQCWGALMSVKAASEEGSTFLCAGGPHPSFVTVDAVKNLKCPLIVLPSKDEPDMVRKTNMTRGRGDVGTLVTIFDLS